MVPPRPSCSGAPTSPSGQRRHNRQDRQVSGGKCFVPLVTRLATKHRMRASRRRVPLSINLVNHPTEAPLPSSQASMVASTSGAAPPEYVRDKLPLFKDSFLAGLRDVRILGAPQRSGHLPRELAITTSEYSQGIAPSHMLAVYASKSPSSPSRTKVTLYPTHEIVLSAHCANLPKLPESSSSSSIPVIPLSIPSPPMYPYLQTYLYTKNISMLENVLLPASSRTPDSSDTSSLMRRLLAVHGLWGNASALGVIDPPFYSMVERVWATLHETLSRVHASPTA